jgi:hypothetical protein
MAALLRRVRAGEASLDGLDLATIKRLIDAGLTLDECLHALSPAFRDAVLAELRLLLAQVES